MPNAGRRSPSFADPEPGCRHSQTAACLPETKTSTYKAAGSPSDSHAMIVSCSVCSTRYLIEPATLGPKGRMVRCAQCGHSWQQSPPADMPHQIDAELALPDLASMSQIRPVARLSGRGIGLPLLLILALMLALGGGYVFRDRVVARWPQASQLYELIGLPVSSGKGA